MYSAPVFFQLMVAVCEDMAIPYHGAGEIRTFVRFPHPLASSVSCAVASDQPV
jgi:hypothetical protein